MTPLCVAKLSARVSTIASPEASNENSYIDTMTSAVGDSQSLFKTPAPCVEYVTDTYGQGRRSPEVHELIQAFSLISTNVVPAASLD